MSKVTIVAIPERDEKVMDLSSEKVPHLTVLYLGEVASPEDAANIVLYVEHAAAQLSPFYMEVDHRGELGPKQADVLFFEKNSWSFPRVSSFRTWLLRNDTVRKYFDAAPQFGELDEWIPHLTMGYPESPAKEDDSDYKHLGSVRFDRISVWIDDYSGPEFRLKYDDNAMALDSAGWSDMSTTQQGADAVNELFHYGVKGMRWGVRKDDNPGSRLDRKALKAHTVAERSRRVASGEASGKDKAKQFLGVGTKGVGGAIFLSKPGARYMAKVYDKKAAKYDQKARAKDAKAAYKKWKEDAQGPEMAAKVFDKATKDFQKTADVVNNDPNYKGKDLTKDAALRRDYDETMNTLFNQHLAQASVDLTVNESGRAIIYQMDRNTGYMRGTEHQAVLDHASSKGLPPDYKVTFDKLGHVSSISAELDLQHFAFGAALAHYGVKGMRWGVTKVDRASQVTVLKEGKSILPSNRPVKVTQRRPGTYAKASGGRRQVATEDAVKAVAARQKAKKSTTDSLTNDELKAANERMRLEQEFRKLDSKTKRKGQNFVQALFANKDSLAVAADLAKRVAANQ